MENEEIIIKPHHLLDIFKLYGAGIEFFTPDKKYNHDFYLLANQIIANSVSKIKFTINGDMICYPCKFYKFGICNDRFIHNGELTVKDKYNKDIDIQLLTKLNLQENIDYDFISIVQILSEKLNFEIINSVWSTNSQSDNLTRYTNTIKGLNRLVFKLYGNKVANM